MAICACCAASLSAHNMASSSATEVRPSIRRTSSATRSLHGVPSGYPAVIRTWPQTNSPAARMGLTLYRNAGGKMRYGLVEGSTCQISLGTHRCQPCSACLALGFHRLHAGDKLRRSGAMLQYHTFIPTRWLSGDGTNKGVTG